MPTITVLDLVRDELLRRGLRASVEHPGYIAITEPDGPNTLCFGTANGPWGFDVEDFDGHNMEIGDETESDIPDECPDVVRIADYIASAYTAWTETKGGE